MQKKNVIYGNYLHFKKKSCCNSYIRENKKNEKYAKKICTRIITYKIKIW